MIEGGKNLKTFYVVFEIGPTINNENYDLIEAGFAICMIVEENSQDAYTKAKFFVERDDWKIENLHIHPIDVTESNFLGNEDDLQQYRKAQKERMAIYYIVRARDEAGLEEPTRLTHKTSNRFNLNDWLNQQKKFSEKGRCLHYDNGKNCNEIISAHSIQKNQSLSAIEDNGHVYVVSRDIGDLKKNKEYITYKKHGINKVSTFLGFCKKHDNELFEPIDNSVLFPTNQQAFLYAYRSLCRELFVKQNAIDLIESESQNSQLNQAIKKLLESHKIGTEFGLNNLKAHKFEYDNSLKNMSYSDINYTLFISKQQPCVAFSGLFYPDFDFMGRQLQDLGNHATNLELITMCFAPMNNGKWGFLFAWHKSSSKVCDEFMGSLDTMICKNKKIGDLLFRLVISNCENIAISPKWWETLSTSSIEKISLKATSMADPFSIIQPDYLMTGLEGIAAWEFEDAVFKK